MALYLCKNSDGTGIVSNDNPLQTKHTSSGEPVQIPVYIFNDGKRKAMPNEQNPPPLIYSNIEIRIEGVGHLLEVQLSPSTSDVNITLDKSEGWNIGTVIKSGLERMRVEEVLTPTSVRVQRNYTADGGVSTIQGHNIGAMFIAETSTVSLALPSIANDNEPGTFLNGGASISTGLDPTYLTSGVDALESSNVIASTKASKYSIGSLIKINNEIMKILSVSNNNMTVLRGQSDTIRQSHNINSIIYCVGVVDVAPVTHKIFIKNDPPSGLPTQKKKDIMVSILADEEEL